MQKYSNGAEEKESFPEHEITVSKLQRMCREERRVLPPGEGVTLLFMVQFCAIQKLTLPSINSGKFLNRIPLNPRKVEKVCQ